MQKFKVVLMSMTLMILSGCQVYGSSFSCRDARGLPCKPLSIVDQQINSGEIEEVELSSCRGKNCRNKSLQIKPDVKLNRTYEAELKLGVGEQQDEAVIIGDKLYVK